MKVTYKMKDHVKNWDNLKDREIFNQKTLKTLMTSQTSQTAITPKHQNVFPIDIVRLYSVKRKNCSLKQNKAICIFCLFVFLLVSFYIIDYSWLLASLSSSQAGLWRGRGDQWCSASTHLRGGEIGETQIDSIVRYISLLDTHKQIAITVRYIQIVSYHCYIHADSQLLLLDTYIQLAITVRYIQIVRYHSQIHTDSQLSLVYT